MEQKIDFVITWVDESDPKWKNEKVKYQRETIDIKINSDARYRDWDNLIYWFRGIEKYTPWVNKIHFVTYGHIPKWLEVNHPKLNIVKHEDFIPLQYLPTFNSNTIELNLHRINGLSEYFVNFNDDMFIIDKMEPTDFFYKNLPKDIGVLNATTSLRGGIGSTISNNMEIINDHFLKKEVILKNKYKYFNYNYKQYNFRNLLLLPWKYFSGFLDPHLPVSYKRSTLVELWEKEKDVLNKTSSHKFRTKDDINHWLFRYWQLASGNFYPQRTDIGTNYSLSDDNEIFFGLIEKKKYKMICLNDNNDIKNFKKQKDLLKKTFNILLPEKSSFEI